MFSPGCPFKDTALANSDTDSAGIGHQSEKPESTQCIHHILYWLVPSECDLLTPLRDYAGPPQTDQSDLQAAAPTTPQPKRCSVA